MICVIQTFVCVIYWLKEYYFLIFSKKDAWNSFNINYLFFLSILGALFIILTLLLIINLTYIFLTLILNCSTSPISFPIITKINKFNKISILIIEIIKILHWNKYASNCWSFFLTYFWYWFFEIERDTVHLIVGCANVYLFFIHVFFCC